MYGCNIGDIDGDEISDIALSAPGYDSIGIFEGRLWTICINRDGSIKTYQRIGNHLGGFIGEIEEQDRFGAGLSALGDFNKDGIYDICVGAPGDDDAESGSQVRNSGALYFLYLNGVPVDNSITDVQARAFSLYPNPCSSVVSVQSKDSRPIFWLQVVGMDGRTLYTRQYSRVMDASMDVSSLPAGQYILRVNKDLSQHIPFTKL